jgi:hypothetical protein
MPEMRAAKGRYFRGDEVGAKVEAVAVTPSAAAATPVVVPVSVSTSGPSAHADRDTGHPEQKIWRH